MLNHITSFILLLTASALTAQTSDKTIYVGRVVSDTNTCKVGDKWTTLPSILKSKNKIEIRFIALPSFENINYTMLTFNQSWHAQHFYYKPYSDTLISKDFDKNVNLDTFFAQLVSNNIFSLPDQDSLKTEKYSYNPETNEFFATILMVNDGTCYVVEFKIGDCYRRYRYWNPKSFADFNPQVYEHRNFVNIVDLFYANTKD